MGILVSLPNGSYYGIADPPKSESSSETTMRYVLNVETNEWEGGNPKILRLEGDLGCIPHIGSTITVFGHDEQIKCRVQGVNLSFFVDGPRGNWPVGIVTAKILNQLEDTNG